MPKPLAARQSVRVANVAINSSAVQSVRFVSKTVRGNPLMWTKTSGFPKIILRRDNYNDGQIYAHLPRQKNEPIVVGDKWLNVWLDAIKQVWGDIKSKKPATWHPAPTKKASKPTAKKASKPIAKKASTKKVTFGDVVTKGPANMTREMMEDFDDVEVVATTKTAAKAATKKASSGPKKFGNAKIGKTTSKEKAGKAIDLNADFDDELSFPDA